MKSNKTMRRPRPLPSARQAAINRPTADATPRRTLIAGPGILEYLANCQHPATLSAICEGLQVTDGMINRSISGLEDRGHGVRDTIARSCEGTGKLPKTRSTGSSPHQLLTRAERVMQTLCKQISQSCNMAIASGDDMLVVAQQPSPGPFSIAVPVGYRYDVLNTAPGLAYIAFASQADPARWSGQIAPRVDAQTLSPLRNAIEITVERGFAQADNPVLPDVIDLSCPVYQGGRFAAILTVPFIQTVSSTSLSWAIAALQMAAERLGESLQGKVLVA